MQPIQIIDKKHCVMIAGLHHRKRIGLIAQQIIIIPVMCFDHGLKQFALFRFQLLADALVNTRTRQVSKRIRKMRFLTVIPPFCRLVL